MENINYVIIFTYKLTISKAQASITLVYHCGWNGLPNKMFSLSVEEKIHGC